MHSDNPRGARLTNAFDAAASQRMRTRGAVTRFVSPSLAFVAVHVLFIAATIMLASMN